MIRCIDNLPECISEWRTFQSRCLSVPALVIHDPEWRGIALGTADRTLTVASCPGPLKSRILKTLAITPTGVSESVWSLGRLRGLIQEVRAIVQRLHVNRRPVKGKPDNYHLRQSPMAATPQEAEAIDAVRDIIREWVLTEKRLEDSEHDDPEEAIKNIEGILGIRGTTGLDTNRDMWSRIIKGHKSDAKGGVEGFAEAGASSVVQSDAAAAITRSIGEWLTAGGRTQDQWERAGNDPSDSPTGGAISAGTANAIDDYHPNAEGGYSLSDPLLVPDMQEAGVWLVMVLAAWASAVQFHIPRLVTKHLLDAGKAAGHRSA